MSIAQTPAQRALKRIRDRRYERTDKGRARILRYRATCKGLFATAHARNNWNIKRLERQLMGLMRLARIAGA